ncbi:unnamed protein product, partial [Pylaiella littoralis]
DTWLAAVATCATAYALSCGRLHSTGLSGCSAVLRSSRVLRCCGGAAFCCVAEQLWRFTTLFSLFFCVLFFYTILFVVARCLCLVFFFCVCSLVHYCCMISRCIESCFLCFFLCSLYL